MKNRQFITILTAVIVSIGLSLFNYFYLSNSINSIEIPKCNETKNDGNYHMDEKEFNKLIYQIQEDSHFCRLGIQEHRDEFLNRFK